MSPSAGIGAIAGLEAGSDPVPPQGASAWQAASVAGMPVQFALLALTLTAVTSDYATGGIIPALQWMSTVADLLPGSGAAFLLIGEVPGMTWTSSVVTMLCWAGGALLFGWLRLARDDANR